MKINKLTFLFFPAARENNIFIISNNIFIISNNIFIVKNNIFIIDNNINKHHSYDNIRNSISQQWGRRSRLRGGVSSGLGSQSRENASPGATERTEAWVDQEQDEGTQATVTQDLKWWWWWTDYCCKRMYRLCILAAVLFFFWKWLNLTFSLFLPFWLHS